MKEKKKDRQGSIGSGVLGRSASVSRLSAEAKSQMKHIETSRAQLRKEVSSGTDLTCRQQAPAWLSTLLPAAAGLGGSIPHSLATGTGIQSVWSCHTFQNFQRNGAQKTLRLHQR